MAWYVLMTCNGLLTAGYFLFQYNYSERRQKAMIVQAIPAVMDFSSHQPEKNDHLTIQLKPFNPNEATEQQWIDMGVKEKTAKSIRKYLEKGGSFKDPDDLSKIWGLSNRQFQELKPFVRISQLPSKQTIVVGKKANRQQLIELNAADSQQLERLPRIGPAMARRIIAYRIRLGGFIEIGQLREVWGIQDSVFEAIQSYFTVDAKKITLIDINTESLEALRLHPYFGYRTAQALIAYRNQHGNFNSLEEIQQIISIDEKIYRKIMQYLTLKKIKN